MKVTTRPSDIVRILSIFLLGGAAMNLAIAREGYHVRSLAVAIMAALVGALLTLQIRRSVYRIDEQARLVRQAARQAESHYISVLRRVVMLVEGREKNTAGHSSRVAELSSRIARQLGLSEKACEEMALAGELHDIGMLVVPESIISERSQIGVAAFQAVKQHCGVGYEVLKPLESLEAILPAIRDHHERMNGTGYPAGLAGDEISLSARIVAVADVFDAMTHDRPHRAAMTVFAAMKELQRCSPAGYAVECVEALGEVVGMPKLELAFAETAGGPEASV